jgi:hypothetical protein
MMMMMERRATTIIEYVLLMVMGCFEMQHPDAHRLNTSLLHKLSSTDSECSE